ncbi:MAG: class II fructose-bisphosphate aldolase [Candidatus Omnitrophota bacterium]
MIKKTLFTKVISIFLVVTFSLYNLGFAMVQDTKAQKLTTFNNIESKYQSEFLSPLLRVGFGIPMVIDNKKELQGWAATIGQGKDQQGEMKQKLKTIVALTTMAWIKNLKDAMEQELGVPPAKKEWIKHVEKDEKWELWYTQFLGIYQKAYGDSIPQPIKEAIRETFNTLRERAQAKVSSAHGHWYARTNAAMELPLTKAQKTAMDRAIEATIKAGGINTTYWELKEPVTNATFVLLEDATYEFYAKQFNAPLDVRCHPGTRGTMGEYLKTKDPEKLGEIDKRYYMRESDYYKLTESERITLAKHENMHFEFSSGQRVLTKRDILKYRNEENYINNQPGCDVRPIMQKLAVIQRDESEVTDIVTIGKAQDVVTSLIDARDQRYSKAINAENTANLINEYIQTTDHKDKTFEFMPGKLAYTALKQAQKTGEKGNPAIIAANVLNRNQIKGHILAAMKLNSALILEVAGSQLKYALNEQQIMKYVREAMEELDCNIPVIVHGDHIQYAGKLYDQKAMLVNAYDGINEKGAFKKKYNEIYGKGAYEGDSKICKDTTKHFKGKSLLEILDKLKIQDKVVKKVSQILKENKDKERANIAKVNERLIKAGFTSVAIDASTVFDQVAVDATLRYYAEFGSDKLQEVARLERDFDLPLEWGADILKMSPYNTDGKERLAQLKKEITFEMEKRGADPKDIENKIKALESAFGKLVNVARAKGWRPDDVINAYDLLMAQVANAAIKGEVDEDVRSSMSDEEKAMLLPTSNAEETAYQLQQLNELVAKHNPDLKGILGKEVEIGHVDSLQYNPKTKQWEAKLTHPATVKVMGDYLRNEGLEFDLIATNNGSGHGTTYNDDLTPKSQVGKISPYLTVELAREAANFNAAPAQHGTSGSDDDELGGLSESGVIKFNIATNYQQLLLNVLHLLHKGLTWDQVQDKATTDRENLVNGLHADVRAEMLKLAREFAEGRISLAIKKDDSLFMQFMKKTYLWGIKNGKTAANSPVKDIAKLLAVEFKRVFGEMDRDLSQLERIKSFISKPVAVQGSHDLNIASMTTSIVNAVSLGDKPVAQVRVDVELEGGAKAHFVVPAGTSSGSDEADTINKKNGPLALLAKERVNAVFAEIKRCGLKADQLSDIARLMLDMSKDMRAHGINEGLGAEVTLGVQTAIAWASARQQGLEPYEMLRQQFPDIAGQGVPKTKIQYNITNGGEHAKNDLDMQEFMVVTTGKDIIESNIMCDKIDRALGEIYQALGLDSDPDDKGVGALRGKEGGYKIENLNKNKLAEIYDNAAKYTKATGGFLKVGKLKKLGVHEFVLNCLIAAIEKAGYKANKSGEIGTASLAFDLAATSMIDPEAKAQGEFLYDCEGEKLTSTQLVDMLDKWVGAYPIDSIEDCLDEDDWDGWMYAIEKLGDDVLLIGDDLLVTQAGRLMELIRRMDAKGWIDKKTGKITKKMAVLIKLNQNGFLTTGINDPADKDGYLGTMEVIRLAKRFGFEVVISHRSKEAEATEYEVSIAEVAAGVDAYGLKSGDHVQATRGVKEDRYAAIHAREKAKAQGETVKSNLDIMDIKTSIVNAKSLGKDPVAQVRVDVTLAGGARSHFVVPAGTSSGSDEADTMKLRGRTLAEVAKERVDKVFAEIKKRGLQADQLSDIARLMMDMSREMKLQDIGEGLGAEVTLGVQTAIAWASARQQGLEPYEMLRQQFPDIAGQGVSKTKIQYNITNGGEHAKNDLDMQEFMVVTTGKDIIESNIMCDQIDRALGEIYQALELDANPDDEGVGNLRGKEGGYKIENLNKKRLAEIYANAQKYTEATGGFLKVEELKAQNLGIHEFVLNCLIAGIKKAGYTANNSGKTGTAGLAFDLAATSMVDKHAKEKGEFLYKYEGGKVTSTELVDILRSWVDKYPIDSIEDCLDEDDWEGWMYAIDKLGDDVLLIGDDLLVTQAGRLMELIRRMEAKGWIDKKTGKITKKMAVLIKLNQNGFLSTGINDPARGYLGTMEVIRLAKSFGFEVVISHRSKEADECEQEFSIADVAAGVNAYGLKSGDHVQRTRAVKEDRYGIIDDRERDKAKIFGGVVNQANLPKETKAIIMDENVMFSGLDDFIDRFMGALYLAMATNGNPEDAEYNIYVPKDLKKDQTKIDLYKRGYESAAEFRENKKMPFRVNDALKTYQYRRIVGVPCTTHLIPF